MSKKPIFYDETGHRAKRLSILGWTGAVLSTLLGVAVIVSILISQNAVSPDLPNKLSRGSLSEISPDQRARKPELLRSARRLAREARVREKLARHWQREALHKRSRSLSQALAPHDGEPLVLGFYVNWDDYSYQSLKRSLPMLDWMVPTWMFVSGKDMHFKLTIDQKALKLVRRMRPNLPILPVLQNAEAGTWFGDELGALLKDKDRRTALEEQVINVLAQNRMQGIVIDFEDVPESAHQDLIAFMSEMEEAFQARGWVLAQAAPFDDPHWPYAEYASHVDYTILMAYDEHDNTSAAGPIAGQLWFEQKLDKRMKTLDPKHTILALGSYGYDWAEKSESGTPVSFIQAVTAARDAGANIQFDAASNNPHFTYYEDGDIKHHVWFLDSITLYNQIHAADAYQPAGYALWRLGSEDPTVWSVFDRRYGAGVPQGILHIPSDMDVNFEGHGEILRIEDNPTPGARRIDVEKSTGAVVDEAYTTLPTNYVIRRTGLSRNKLALTFDDGPDPTYTPKILKILKQKNVKATFFEIGANIQAHPELVEQVLADGHEIGNHTYTHPDMAETSAEVDRLELNATQRLFEAMTGRSMRLFRPPYLSDAEPSTDEQILPVKVAQKLGYIIVGVHVDPLDWQRPTVDQMIQRIDRAIHNPNPEWRGNIIMLHDSGGDRSETIKILPKLIDKMRAEGFHFVLASELAGISRDQAMPPMKHTLWLTADRVAFIIISWIGNILYYCFILAVILGIGRLLFLMVLALSNRKRARKCLEEPPEEGTHKVSVIIPAFNEEKVIARTITRILHSTYKNLDIIVVDDGSKDKTVEIVRAGFGEEPRVRLLPIPNGGKANALNTGMKYATGDIVVALDADTIFHTDTIARLVRWFDDPEIGAVAGNAKVGNRTNMITRWQALEYIVAQNLERRALDRLSCFTVVPGAVGAWRKNVIQELGGFPQETLAEDQDLTIALQQSGYKVRYDATAIAWTEAPDTVGGLARQRYRWAFGTLQCLWKYRHMTFNPKYRALGMVALPQVWLFQILLTAFAPLADLLLIFQLLGQWMSYLQHGPEFTYGSLYKIALFYAIFTVVDLVSAMFGFLLERREKWSLLWWLMLQRFGYRQLMYYVVIRSIRTALRGALVGWNKLERTGTVNEDTAGTK